MYAISIIIVFVVLMHILYPNSRHTGANLLTYREVCRACVNQVYVLIAMRTQPACGSYCK